MPGEKTKKSDKQKKPPKIIGKAYDLLKDRVKSAAKNDIPILLIGERGSGKEIFKNCYMTHNDRTGPKMTIDCAAVDEALLRPEIFGHVKGAFTDAKQDRSGKLIHCDGGILCLDELGDASEAFQAAILRVVEQNSFSKVGSDEEEVVDTLVIAATNKPQELRKEIKDRFNIFYVPPLQKEDIPALATYFFQKIAKKNNVFPREDVISDLMALEYPGNVRQLQKACERLLSDRKEAVMGKKRPKQPLPDVPPFDYQRFVREYQFWFEHIEPIIEKVDLAFELSYVYQPLKKEISEERLKHAFQGTIDSGAFQTGYFHHYRHGKRDRVDFTIDLERLIKIGSLPSYIKWAHSEVNPDKPWLQNIKPSLSPLLDMASPDEAIAEFKRYYYQNLLKKHDNNMKKAAESLGTNSHALWQKIDRLEKKSGSD